MWEHLTKLRQILATHFDEEELRTLCFDLSLDYDDLPAKGRAHKARELVRYVERHDLVYELLKVGKHLRPDVPWDDAIVRWAQARLDASMDRLRAKRDQTDQTRRARRECQRVVNLRPLDMTHTFRDRQREVQALCDYLTEEGVRLVNIVGRGGMGKTALACRILADLEVSKLPFLAEQRVLPVEGILYLSARSTGLSLERIYADVGRMLGEPATSQLAARWADRDTPLTAKVEHLLEAMQDGLYLILLDNLEDMLSRDGTIKEEGLRFLVERCLTQPDGVRLIVTSREQVKIAAAALRGARSISLREGLPEEDAVALLRDLDPQGALGLRDALEENLRRAVRLTRGIPRALEILAGILHEDPTASLPRLLVDEDLFGEQVMERLVAAGYRRLGEDERRIIETLAVFDRPVEETAIAYLLYPWFPGLDVRACLRRLVSGYFVNASRVTGEYSLHPLDRDYAYRQIPEKIETEIEIERDKGYTRRNLDLRAADFYVSIRKPESEWKSIEDLAPQLAEFEHRFRARDYDGACLVLGPINAYLFLWGHYTRLVELREKLLGRLTVLQLQASNLGSLGRAHHALGRFEQAIKLHEEALTIEREIGNRRGEGIRLNSLGNSYRALGQVERAIQFYEEVLIIDREIGNRRGEGIRLSNLGNAKYSLGQVEQAINLCEEALAISREIGHRKGEGIRLNYLGDAYRALGQVERAIQFYEEALAIAREIGDRRGEGIRHGNLGNAYRALGQIEQAIRLYEEALTIACEIGDRRNRGLWLGRLGDAYCTLGQVERAIELCEEALTIARETGHRRGESYQLLRLGTAMLVTGELSLAYQRCREARELDVPATSYQAALALGIVLLHQRDPTAGDAFVDTTTRCRVMLDKTAGLYEPRYALAAALVGTAVCDPRWAAARESERLKLLAPALAEYRRALENCSAPGVVGDTLRDLKLIRAAGVEGLESVFELLEGTGG